jgi:hypothetical protein
MSMHRWMISASVALALAGCGSATDATTFTAPPGYTTAVSVGPFAQVWRGPKGTRSGIVLTALPGELAFNKITESSNIKDAQMLKDQAVKICGNQDAYYLSMIGESPQSESGSAGGATGKQRIDVIATHLNGKTYLAMYVRPQGAAEDPGAESAIHGICPKS